MANVVAIASTITAIIAVIKSAYELGVEVWPNMRILIGNLEKLFNAYVNGDEVTDQELLVMQAETEAMSQRCHEVYLAKYGESDNV